MLTVQAFHPIVPAMDPTSEPHRSDNTATPTAPHFTPSTTYPPPPMPQDQFVTDPTPTRDSFGLSEKRPLSPDKSTSQDTHVAPSRHDEDLSRPASLQSLKSNDTQGSSTTGAAEDAVEGSDNEEGSASYRPQKKKKSQRFFCTDYPPCNLSFTRSEHLARHIR